LCCPGDVHAVDFILGRSVRDAAGHDEMKNGDRTLSITLGGIAERPGVVDGQIAIREYLCMTLSFNHAIIDGAPAARFTARLKELIESGYGLDDFTVASEQAVALEASKKNESSPH